MRYIYLLVALGFLGLGAFYFFHEKGVETVMACPFCVDGNARNGLCVVEPAQPVVHGHMVIYTHHHVASWSEMSAEHQRELVEALTAVDRLYWERYQVVGHTMFINVSEQGHLFFEVIPNMGVKPYCYFGLLRWMRPFRVDKLNLLLGAKPAFEG